MTDIWIQNNVELGLGVVVIKACNEIDAENKMNVFANYLPDEPIRRLTIHELRDMIGSQLAK